MLASVGTLDVKRSWISSPDVCVCMWFFMADNTGRHTQYSICKYWRVIGEMSKWMIKYMKSYYPRI